jgi:hypothetical protein
LQKTHKDLEIQFDALWSTTSSTPSNDPDRAKASTSNGCERCYNIDVNALFANGQQSNVEQICVESCDKFIDQENDHLKLEVKRLEQEVMMLKKQAKAQPTQDNYRNMLNKLENGKTVPKLDSQQQVKPTQHKKQEKINVDEKIEYVMCVFLNVIRSHIKNGIGYKGSDKHNSRVKSNGKEFIKFNKIQVQQEKKQSKVITTTLTIFLILPILMHLIFLICHIMILMHLMFS